eukprot:COSAG05_NODE_821_length_7122_cov_142.066781_2_plen_271_part_00
MPPKRDSLGRRVKGAGKGAVGQRKGRQTKASKAAAAPPTEPAASRPARRLSAVAAFEKIVELADDQEATEALGLQDMLAAAGVCSEARAHEAWAYYWAHTLRAPMDEESWDGPDGVVAQIRRVFREAPGSAGSIRQVLEDVKDCVLEHAQYCGNRDAPKRARAKLALDGPEASIIADVLEEGQSLRDVLVEVNDFRVNRGLEHVGLKAVWSCFKALDPIEDEVLDRKQGKSDPNSEWARARFNWITYLLVRFGHLTAEQLADRFPSIVPL